MEYVALQVKTCYSILESMNDIKKLVARAKELGYTSLAITDDNNMFGVMEFYLECQKMGIKPIIGLSLDVLNSKVLLYARNMMGYKNLVKLATMKSERDIAIDDLRTYRDNLVMIMPNSYFNQEIFDIYDIKYVGYDNTLDRDNIGYDKVFINDVAYLQVKDAIYLDYLQMIRNGKVLGEVELTKEGQHFLPDENYVNLVSNDRDIANTKKISEMCNVTLDYTPDLLPIYDEKRDAYSYLEFLCNKGLRKRLNDEVPEEYQERLNYELDVIKKMGFCDYFLIVWDYVKYAKFNGILVGPGRGSAAGSLVSYTLGITDIDPLKYDLLFERFLNPERVTMPDIDIDFDAERREEVINYVINKYGEKRVAGIITFNTLGAKQVIRDVGRVMEINALTIDNLCRLCKGDLESTYKSNKRFRNMLEGSMELRRLYDVARHLEGLPRHVSVHAAGIVMSRRDLDETIPLYYTQLGMYVSSYSKDYLEDLGLLKMDFLGITNLTLIADIINNIREKERINITFSNIPLGDAAAFKIFHDVNVNGIFQFESPGMKRFLRGLRIRTFDDIVLALALYRPGPMGSIGNFIRRRGGLESIDYIHEDLKGILLPTYGIIVYQEQIMQIARVLAGYSYGKADVLRRAMSKKKESVLIEERPKFINGCIKNGYSEEMANYVYDLILRFANYGFNKSHSVGYAMVAYRLAYLKAHFYKYFASSVLTNVIGSVTKTKIYVTESKQMGVKIRLPDINMSSDKYVMVDDEILCPLSVIKSVGTMICHEIMEERKDGEFDSFLSFARRMVKRRINKNLMSALIMAGCFEKLGYNRRTLMENLDVIWNYAELSQDMGITIVEEPVLEEVDDYTAEEMVAWEEELFGFYLSDHPVMKFRRDSDINTAMIEEFFDKQVGIVLQLDRIKETTTKKNDVMAFMTGSDEYGEISLTLFPEVYNGCRELNVSDIVRVWGRIEKRFDEYQLVVRNMVKVG